ncbi:dihydrofolate reductase family protein [Microbispora sp. ATCC PTA-5024]|uniref:dihydrofolate reductase family protein n=1 Tax=Microbispora sp. ATCC PTA-5024 TaxID=316330 RepID=UPI00056CA231|nr:dihydrofolate reductase family protein [Microbispora sp. ATCC PTA-5024]
MNRLIVHMQASMDGFVGSDVGGSTWQLWDWGPDWPWSADVRKRFNDVVGAASGILLSRPMITEGYLGHWRRTADEHPDDPDYRFAHRIGELPTFVVTGHSLDGDWPRTTVINAPLAEGVRRALTTAGGDVICFGGAGFVNGLLREDLVDELHLFVNPGVAGEGPRIFDRTMSRDSYELVDASPSDCGILLARWRRRRRSPAETGA